jgi:phosphohistidine phosphatase
MDLFVIRHADAVPFSEFSGPDEDRYLTERGHQEARRLGSVFQAKQLLPTSIVTSPLLRAQETALEFASVLGFSSDQIQINEQLAPGGKFRKLGKHLKKLSSPAVALIGHMPDLSELTGWLIGSRKVEINFAKSGVALVRVEGEEIEKGCGELLWFVSPDWY